MGTDVAIYMLAYNHEPWIRKALDGILQQQTTYRYQLLVNDDVSTDGTRAIIEEYAQKYPDVIVPIFHEVNQYSQKISNIRTHIYPRIHSKYVMMCEGDDYWVDPCKLQKQIDYMEQHPDCTFGFSDAYLIDVSGARLTGFFDTYKWKEPELRQKMQNPEGCDLSTEEIIRLDFTPTASSVCRYEAFRTLCEEYPSLLDVMLRVVCTHAGYAHYFNEKFTAYRTGNANSASGSITGDREKFRKSYYEKHKRVLKFFEEYTGGQYGRVIDRVLSRKDLECSLNFLPIAQLRKHPAYCELTGKYKTKLYIRKKFGTLYGKLRKLKIALTQK